MNAVTRLSSISLRCLSVALAMGAMASACQAADAPPATPLKFGDFFRQPIGPKGLELSERLLSARGQTVRMVGWMVAQETPPAGYFLFTPRPVRLSEHADGDADDLPPATVLVRLPAEAQDQAWPHQDGLVELQGTLAVGRSVEADGRVSWIQLQLSSKETP